MGLSVSGLVGGIDVPTVVSQLMQSESIPQAMLQNQLTAVQNQASTYRAINSKFQALLTAAQSMTDTATWNATAATSSDSSIAVTSTGAAATGSMTFAVTQTAAAETQITQAVPPYSSATAAYPNSTIAFVDSSGKATSVPVGGTGTLSDAASAINAAKLGVTATVVQVGTGQFQLQIASTTTGAASSFTLDGGTGWSEVTKGQNAVLTVGNASTYTVSSPTNTFTGLMPGVTLTVSKPTTAAATVSVAGNPQAVGDKMKALVNAANAVLDEISSDTATGMSATGTSSGSAGPLAGDYTAQSLAQQVRNLVSSAVGSLGSPSQIGLQLANPLDPTAKGDISFAEDTFVNFLKSNPSAAQSMVVGIPAVAASAGPPPTAAVAAVPGIAARLATLATSATDSVTGTLITLAKGDDSQATSLKSQIDDWTTRLAATQQQLTTTYTNMQTMLSSLQNQQSWLSSMFGAMTSSSSSSSSKSS